MAYVGTGRKKRPVEELAMAEFKVMPPSENQHFTYGHLPLIADATRRPRVQRYRR